MKENLTQPAQRNADRSRAAILDAAEELFSRLGYEAVSLADVAGLAGVSRGLPSYFFRDKQTLYRTVMEQAAAQNRGAVLDAVRSMHGGQPRQILLKLLDRYIEYLAANPRVVRLLQWEALQFPAQRRQEEGTRIPQRVFFEASELISERLKTRKIGGIDIPDLLLSIVSMCLYPFQVIPAAEARRQSFVQRHKRHVSAMVLRAIEENT